MGGRILSKKRLDNGKTHRKRRDRGRERCREQEGWTGRTGPARCTEDAAVFTAGIPALPRAG